MGSEAPDGHACLSALAPASGDRGIGCMALNLPLVRLCGSVPTGGPPFQDRSSPTCKHPSPCLPVPLIPPRDQCRPSSRLPQTPTPSTQATALDRTRPPPPAPRPAHRLALAIAKHAAQHAVIPIRRPPQTFIFDFAPPTTTRKDAVLIWRCGSETSKTAPPRLKSLDY